MKRMKSLAAALTVAGAMLAAPVATAAEKTPADIAGDTALSEIQELEVDSTIEGQKWYQKYADDERVLKLQATSPAMDGRKVPLAIIRAQNPDRPTIYLLNGAGSAEQDTDWLNQSEAVDFYADKDVNVVIPQAGAFSYYTDWNTTPNKSYLKGPQKWETFLTKELPGPLEERLQSNNKRAIAGMSMSATSSLLLAQHNQGFYDAVGSYAGCAGTSTPFEYEAMRLTVNRGGGEPEQMWGKMGSRTNRYNDALLNSDKLRGTALYISSGNGLPGETDMPSYYTKQGVDPTAASVGAATLQIEGGIIEAGVNHCTHNLEAKLKSQNIPAIYNFRDTGTHSWPGWREDLEKSWPVFEKALF
ncbi:alpha/beta hydrolase [Corynebacterium stationis]|uniref:alpha/beta hydrolase n=1 Tax=Corynebacterium stationis TaxID=1705 RepID=UPI00076F7A96|nr:alpha/beta hydrolase family protein [Corynebacterium stationis]AMJ43806.1 esterase [Corynebacterium stationis]AQX70258.1 esterase [Corynebacterium stationis]ASJ17956.1 esterase [Corynebacterium stationis]HJG65615.1 esterase family protein [Corynebacterium stationis]